MIEKSFTIYLDQFHYFFKFKKLNKKSKFFGMKMKQNLWCGKTKI